MEEKIITPKEAYAFAVKYFKELVGDFETTLEEIERFESLNTKNWYVTISYLDKGARDESVMGVKVAKRRFKKFVIDAHTGEFRAMRNA